MKIMGASTALAGIGLAGCRRPEMHLVPFTKSAEWVIPGKFLFYTSSRPAARGYVPVIVSTYEGRPTKSRETPITRSTTDTAARTSTRRRRS